MKIKRVVNGVEMEFELTQNELMGAWVAQQHLFDMDYIEGMFGADERFDGMSEEEKARALSDIAWKFVDKISGIDDPDRFEVASDAVEEYFEERKQQKADVGLVHDVVVGSGRYEIEVTVDVVGGDGKDICLKFGGNDLGEMQAGILPAVQKACAERGYLDNQIVVGVLIEENGEWLDSDEETYDLGELSVWVCCYKDCLGYLDNDNVTDILVPMAWLQEKLKDEGETDFEGWFEEYTADSTDMIARDAVSEGVVLSCADKRISCVLGLGESFLNVNDYGKTLAGKMREVYRDAYSKDGYGYYGTDVIGMDSVKSVEDAAGVCLLTYGDRAMQEIQELIGDKGSLYGFDVQDVRDVLKRCVVPEKDNSLEDKLVDAIEKSEKQADGKDGINLDEYEYISNVDGYSTFRKIVRDEDGNPRGIWAARHQDGGEAFPISYKQAQGFEPIEDTPIKRLARELGEMLLP